MLAVLQSSLSFKPGFDAVAVGPRVSGHAAATHNGKVLVHGGLTDGAGSPCTDELWSFDPEARAWSQLAPVGGPGVRMYAASAVVGDHFYSTGGWDPGAPGSGGEFKDEVWKMDLATLEWTQLPALPGGPASRHTACAVGGKVVVQTFRGTIVVDGDAVSEQPTSGDAPLGFSMSAACALNDAEMLVFGGSTKEQGMTADAYVLDTRTWAWRKLRAAAGEAPTPRGSACAAAVDATTAIVFGDAGLGGGGYGGGAGLTPYDETWRLTVDGETATWSRLDNLGTPPAPRVAASLNKLPSGDFLLHGGWTPKGDKETFAESHVLDLGM